MAQPSLWTPASQKEKSAWAKYLTITRAAAPVVYDEVEQAAWNELTAVLGSGSATSVAVDEAAHGRDPRR